MATQHSKLIEKACRRLETAGDVPDLATLAAEAGLSRWHFQRLFTATIGISPKRYAMAQRQKRLQSALVAAPSVTDAIFDSGYAASSGAYRDLGSHGLRPKQLRNGGAGEPLHFATAESSLGTVMVAASVRGICMVEFGNAPELLLQLKQRFANATLSAAPRRMRDYLRRVINCIDDPQHSATLPLDIRGTAFQVRVWQALTKIPAGQTVSYAQLARRIGSPTSTRAVARACATNGIAVLVPCHRVIGSDGQLRGYKWGLDRKRQLLQREGVAQPR
jgi:AraC family transcriptional regulator, regulatory protein of adaptative response / methylated-DNA-[protein]-cysteine methyltransferase